MKKKATTIMLAWLTVMTIALQSCNNDDDDYYTYPYLQPTAVVTVKPDSGNTSFLLQVDDSTRVIPTNMRVSPFGNKEVRALVNFTPNASTANQRYMPVTINWIDSILTKPTVPDYGTKNDSVYGNDPVEVVNSWETVAEDGYLTLRFRTRWLPSSVHTINLVHRPEADNPYILELYHDANSNPMQGAVADGMVAFRLDDAFNRPDTAITITLKWYSYSGPKTHKFRYRPRKD